VVSFLQSSAWGDFQKKLGRTVIIRANKDWRYLAIVERGTGNTRLYTPYGPECNSLAAFDAATASLITDAKQAKASFIRIEPTYRLSPAELKERGFKPVTYNQLQPAHTSVIDLTQSENDIIAHMSQNTRNIYRNYHKKDVRIVVSHNPKDIEILLGFLHSVATRNHITPHSDEYFRTQASTLLPIGAASLFIAYHHDTPIAASLMFDSPSTRIYAHAAANDEYRKLSVGTALLAYAILDAKKSNKTHFDLYGVAPESEPDHPWAGFSKFKRSFGGSDVEYSGAWDKPLRPLSYYLYRTYQSVKNR